MTELQGAAKKSRTRSIEKLLENGLLYVDGKRMVKLDYREAEQRLKERETVNQ